MALTWKQLKNFTGHGEVKQTNDFLSAAAKALKTTPLIFAKVSLGSNQSVPTAPTFTTINFDVVNTDEESLWSSADKAFVVPAGYTKMLIQSEVAFWPGTGGRQAVVRKNGASFSGEPSFYMPANGADITRMTFSGMLEVTEGEKYSIQVYHSAGSNIDIGATSTWFSITLYPTGMAAIKGDDGADGTNGTDGAPGADGADGYTPIKGVDYFDGADGADGVGVPAGGTTGQVLAKSSATDYATQWVDQSGGGGTADDVANQNDSSANDPLKLWEGTKAQYAALTPAADTVYIISDEDDSEYPVCVDYQTITTDTTVGNQRIMRGWGYIRGTGATSMTLAITFKDAFDAIPTVIPGNILKLKAYANGAPTNEGDVDTDASVFWTTGRTAVTTSGFTVKLHGGSAFSSNYYALFNWFAIGTKARV